MGVFGLVFTASGDCPAVVVGHMAAEPLPTGLIRAVWIAESLLLAISLLDLAVVAVLWGIYQLRRR